MKWYRDISRKHIELGFEKDPTLAFIVPFVRWGAIYALICFVVFCLAMD